MVAGPLVDDTERLAVGEVALLRSGIVVLLCLLHEAGEQLVGWIVDEDGIGDADTRCLVEQRTLREHLSAELVDGFLTGIAEAQGVAYLLLCLSLCAVVEHSEGIGDTQRRENLALVATGLTEEIEGKVVVGTDQLLLFFRQRYLAARVLQLFAHILADEEDDPRRLFADDVEERTVGNEVGIIQHTVGIADNGYCGSLRTLFVDLNLSHLLHQVDEDVVRCAVKVLAEIVEALTALEGIGHAELLHDADERLAGFRLEAWQPQIHLVWHIGTGGVPVGAVEIVDNVVERLFILRQEHRHLVGRVAVRQDDRTEDVVLGEEELVVLHHHLGCLLAVIKLSVDGIFRVELSRPFALEIDGVEQIADVVGIEIRGIQHLVDHPLRVVAGPLVDNVERRWVGEVEGLGGHIIVVGHRLAERLRHSDVAACRVHIDAVGYRHTCQLVELSRLREQLVAELIDGFGTGRPEAQYLVDFLLRLSLSAVVEHSEGVGDAQRRENEAFAASRLSEEVESEVVVTAYQLKLFAAEADRFWLVRLSLRPSGERHHRGHKGQCQLFSHHYYRFYLGNFMLQI